MGLSILKTVDILLVAAFLSFSEGVAHATSCHQLLGEENSAFTLSKSGKIKISSELGEMILDTAKDQLNSTTGNRMELKRTLTIANLNKAFEKLGRTFSLKPRDNVKPGTRNVTVTQYLNVLKFDYKGKELSVKIRFRKYGTIQEGLPMKLENVVINPDMKDISFFEMKIDHPDFDSSVLKPRGPQLDSDISLIGTKEYLDRFEGIKARALQRNSGTPEAFNTMTKMQNVMKKLAESGVPLKWDSQTVYERKSYSLLLHEPVTNKNYEIQITEDKDILLHSYSHNKTIDAYKSDQPLAVVELKIPVEMIDSTTKGFKNDILAAIPTLKEIKEFLAQITASQAPGYEEDKGKQSLIKAILESQKN